ncbi:glycerophosphodiester phosphodiesterase [bacterium]|nr:glycerophosphodiester phosphodiesterase [bacterium]
MTIQSFASSRFFLLKRVPFFLFAISLLLTACDQQESTVDRNRAVDLQGHRGARGDRPENTLPAFLYCMEQKMTTLELDTVVTRDKQLIVYHDTNLNGKLCLDANGNPAESIPIKNLSVEELKTYDCGSLVNEDFPDMKTVPGTRLSTLNEVFKLAKNFENQHNIKPRFLYNIELKFAENHSQQEVDEAARLMVKAIEDADLTEYVTVQCFVMEMLPAVRKLNPNLKLSALFQPTIPQGIRLMIGFKANSDEILQKAIKAGANVISPYYLYIKPDFVKASHAANLEVLPWVVNDADKMTKMMNLNVDGIITDYPKLLFETYQDWKSSSL